MKLDVNKKQLEALKKLDDPKLGLDLMGENVQRLKDRKTRRVLEPILQKVLPRRRRGIEYSSYYRPLRVELLPVNPHFRQDVVSLRELFKIPEGQIADVDLTQFRDRPEPWDKEDVLPYDNAASYWIQLHRHIWCGWKLEDVPPLPDWFQASAGTGLGSTGSESLSWLEKEALIPASYAAWFDLKLPIDRCVARLIERYQLPWGSAGPLRFYILTQNQKYLDRIPPYDVLMEPVDRPIGLAFRVTGDWVDEFTTKKQWLESLSHKPLLRKWVSVVDL